MNELAKIESFRTDLALAETFEEIKLIGDAAEAYLEFVRKQNLSVDAQNRISDFVIEVEEKKGDWLDKNYPHGGTGANQYKSAELPNWKLSKMPATPKESARARAIKKAPKQKKEEIKNKIKEAGGIVTPKKLFNELQKDGNREIKKEREQEELKKNSITDPIIIQNDCLKIIDSIQDIDLLLTDPPYFTDGNFTSHISKYLAKEKSTGQAYVFIGTEPEEVIAYLSMDTHGLILTQILIWNYNNTGQRQPNVRYNSNYQFCLYFRGKDAPDINKPADGKEQYACQTINAPDARQGDRYFKWQKPDELIERLIKNSSKEGDFVFDPFAGSGTILIASAKLGRVVKGCEIDSDLVKICIERGCKNE
jgi:DNA modification methylase